MTVDTPQICCPHDRYPPRSGSFFEDAPTYLIYAALHMSHEKPEVFAQVYRKPINSYLTPFVAENRQHSAKDISTIRGSQCGTLTLPMVPRKPLLVNAQEIEKDVYASRAA